MGNDTANGTGNDAAGGTDDTGADTVAIVADGLGFCEGPVVMPDGAVVVVDVRGGRLVRIASDGSTSDLATPGGGPNGAAIGPDGALYVVNNGGFPWIEMSGVMVPIDAQGSNRPAGFAGGWVDRIDPTTGEVTRLFDEFEGETFVGPNDIVFDAHGGFWFTDFGKFDRRTRDRGALFYANADGTGLRRLEGGLDGPNGVGLSPDGSTVYAAETTTGRLLAWDVTAPGEVAGPHRIVVSTDDHFDSLAVEADGTVVIAAIRHGLCLVRPDGTIEHVAVPDFMTTNVCFGGDDLRTAYVTMSGSGRLGRIDWPRAGLRLAH